MRAAFAKDAMDQTGWIPPGATPTRITDPALLFFTAGWQTTLQCPTWWDSESHFWVSHTVH